MTIITKRAVLGGIAAMPITGALALAAPGQVHPDADFISDLLAWREAYDASCAEDECGPLWDAKCVIANRIIEREARTVVGFAVKILVITEYGGLAIEDEFLDAVVADAQRIVTIPMPRAQADWLAEHGRAS